MKIAVSSTGGSIHSKVEERFGRAPYYIIVDSETMNFGVVANPNVLVDHGAGPQTAQLLIDREVSVVLTGKVGPNAKAAIEAANIILMEGVGGTVQEAVEGYLAKTKP